MEERNTKQNKTKKEESQGKRSILVFFHENVEGYNLYLYDYCVSGTKVHCTTLENITGLNAAIENSYLIKS